MISLLIKDLLIKKAVFQFKYFIIKENYSIIRSNLVALFPSNLVSTESHSEFKPNNSIKIFQSENKTELLAKNWFGN